MYNMVLLHFPAPGQCPGIFLSSFVQCNYGMGGGGWIVVIIELLTLSTKKKSYSVLHATVPGAGKS